MDAKFQALCTASTNGLVGGNLAEELMRLTKAEAQEVIEMEKRIDREFLNLRFPDRDHFVSKWLLLVVFEDSLRNALWELTRNPQAERWNSDLCGFNMLLDRQKYALRYAFDRLYRQQPPTERPNWDGQITPDAYLSAAEFFKFGDDYLLASRALGSYHAGNSIAFCDTSKRMLVLTSPADDITYSVLNMFLADVQEFGCPISALMRAFVNPQAQDLHIDAILRCTRESNGTVKYVFNPFLCNQLLLAIPNPPTVVPDGWMFPWGNSPTAHRIFETLQARCMFHILAIHFGAVRYQLPGYGLADICHRHSRTQLIHELSEVSGISEAETNSVIAAITYGTDTKTPDPALQPLIPFSQSVLAVPTLLVLSSNYPRNYLSLHARIGAASFDKQSRLFELRMSKRIGDAVMLRFPKMRMNSYLPHGTVAGEVDIIVADEASKTILLGELRWFLPPGDPREVNNRKKVCGEKVEQLDKKLEIASQLIGPILEHFRIQDDPNSWGLVGIVVVDGFVAPGPSPERIPVVPIQVFEIGLGLVNNLKGLHQWFISYVWLPQKGIHYIPSPVSAKFGHQKLRWEGFHIQNETCYLPDYITQSITPYATAGLR